MNRSHAIAALAAAISLAGTAVAQTDPGAAGRGLAITFDKDSTRDRVASYEYNGALAYVRIEAREPGSVPNQHPDAIDAAALRDALKSLKAAGSKDMPLFIDAEIDEIAAPLARALARATPEQDVCFAVSGKHGRFGPLSPRLVTAARVFRADGHLNMVFGLVQHDWDNTFHANGVVIAFEPGHRAGPIKYEAGVAVDPAKGTSRRSDWIVFNDTALAAATAPAAAAAPATASAPPPVASPPAAAPPAAAPTAPAGLYGTVSERLRTIRKLLDDGLITQQEYEDKRRQILRDL